MPKILKAFGDRIDTWRSALAEVARLGIRTDKSLFADLSTRIVTYREAHELWRGHDLSAKYVEAWPDAALRGGFNILAKDEERDDLEDLDAALEDLGTEQACWDAWAYERAYGGSGILLGANDGGSDWEQPLNDERVQKFDWLKVLDRNQLSPVEWYEDFEDEKYGQPRLWQMSSGIGGSQSIRVHESRLIIFGGIRCQNQHWEWGDNVFTRVYRSIKRHENSYTASSTLIADFAQAIFKMKGLADLISRDKNEEFALRMKAVELARDIAHAVLIDSDEEFERKSTNVAGLAELLDRQDRRLAAGMDMPVTLLFRMSPGGLNATGESDVRLWYDEVDAKRKKKLTRPLERIARLKMAVMGMEEPDAWHVEFGPLWQLSQTEQAEIQSKQGATDCKYVEWGVLHEKEVRDSRFGGDKFSLDTRLQDDLEEELLEPEEPEPVVVPVPGPGGGPAGPPQPTARPNGRRQPPA